MLISEADLAVRAVAILLAQPVDSESSVPKSTECQWDVKLILRLGVMIIWEAG